MRHQNISSHGMIKEFKGWKHQHPDTLINEPQLHCSMNQSRHYLCVLEPLRSAAFRRSFWQIDEIESGTGHLIIYLPHCWNQPCELFNLMLSPNLKCPVFSRLATACSASQWQKTRAALPAMTLKLESHHCGLKVCCPAPTTLVVHTHTLYDPQSSMS